MVCVSFLMSSQVRTAMNARYLFYCMQIEFYTSCSILSHHHAFLHAGRGIGTLTWEHTDFEDNHTLWFPYFYSVQIHGIQLSNSFCWTLCIYFYLQIWVIVLFICAYAFFRNHKILQKTLQSELNMSHFAVQSLGWCERRCGCTAARPAVRQLPTYWTPAIHLTVFYDSCRCCWHPYTTVRRRSCDDC